MKIEELTEELRRSFSPSVGHGVMKLPEHETNKAWQNIYFVVPLAPPKELSKKMVQNLKQKLPLSLLQQALQILTSLPDIHADSEDSEEADAFSMIELDRTVNYLFSRCEVVQSSRMEGTWSTIDHVLAPGRLIVQNQSQSQSQLRSQSQTTATSLEEKNAHRAVRSYALLLDEIIECAKKHREGVFTQKFIGHINQKILENDPHSHGIPGKLRAPGQPGSVVVVGGGFRKEDSIYNPAPPSEVERCLDDVLSWLGDKDLALQGDAGTSVLSLPVRLAIAHAHFEAIHPFTDGNGRTGRALWAAQMVCAGHQPLYLSGYVEKFKVDYRQALEEAQKRLNYIPLITFISKAIIESFHENEKTKKAIKQLEAIWQDRGNFRAKSGARKALRLLLSKPIISTALIEKELGLSKTASVDAVNTLLEKKIICLRKNDFRELEADHTARRARIYAAEELIEILARPFGSDVEVAIEKAHILLKL